MSIAVFDTDVLIYIFDTVYNSDKDKFKEVINYFLLLYYQIWIPKNVKKEFLQGKRRKKRYYRFLKRYNYLIKECPINISNKEIDIILTPEIHIGEADGLLQIQKANYYPFYSIRNNLIFVSNDKNAIKAAKKMNIEIQQFTEIQQLLREGGIII